MSERSRFINDLILDGLICRNWLCLYGYLIVEMGMRISVLVGDH